MPTVLTVGSLLLPSLSLSAQAQTRTLAGSVTLLGWKGTAPSNLLPTSLTYLLADQTSPRLLVRTVPYNAATRSTQAFSFSVPPGNYKVTAKMDRFLRTLALGDVRNGNLTNLSLSLPGGDADNSNAVNVDDLTLVLNAYNSATTTQTAGADVDGSGSIDVDDLTVVLNNYNTTGASEPTAAPWHLADLSLSTSGVPAGTTLTGRVTLASAAPPGGTTVTLRTSLDYYATFSSSAMMNVSTRTLTIRAGETQSDLFTVYTANTYFDGEVDHPLTEPAYATISASAFGWTQAAQLTIVPATTSFTVQNLSAIPANGAVVLDWQELPTRSVKGYNVYRTGQTTPINGATPLPSAIYVDNGRTNGTASSYQVTVVKLDGTETSRTATGASASATPTGAAGMFAWIDLPTVPLSEETTLFANLSSSVSSGGVLLIDGKIVAPLSSQVTAEQAAGNTTFPDYSTNLPVQGLTNGSHTVQILGRDNQYAFVSAPLNIVVQLPFSKFSGSMIVTPSANEPMYLEETLPIGTVRWTARILDVLGAAVYAWADSTDRLKVSWDGYDSNGNEFPDGSFTFEVTAYDSNGQATKQQKHGSKVRTFPYTLALFDNTTTTFNWSVLPTGAQTTALTIEKDLADRVKTIFKDSNSSAAGLALRWDEDPGKDKLLKWLKGSVKVFYIQTHGILSTQQTRGLEGGAAQGLQWGKYVFWPDRSTKGGFAADSDISIVVNEIPEMKQYKFVFLDACTSAGGAKANRKAMTPMFSQPGQWTGPNTTVDAKWQQAFNVGGSDRLFCGWNGDISSNFFLPPGVGNNIIRSSSFYWRYHFWDRFAKGDQYYVARDSATHATMNDINAGNCVSTPTNPWDGTTNAFRHWFFGDAFIALP